jgi:hypothetical protein
MKTVNKMLANILNDTPVDDSGDTHSSMESMELVLKSTHSEMAMDKAIDDVRSMVSRLKSCHPGNVSLESASDDLVLKMIAASDSDRLAMEGILNAYKEAPAMLSVSTEGFKEKATEWLRAILEWLKKLGLKIKDYIVRRNHTVQFRIDTVIKALRKVKTDSKTPLSATSHSSYLFVNGKQDVFVNGVLEQKSFLRHPNGWRNYAIGNGVLSLFGIRYQINTILNGDRSSGEFAIDDMQGDLKDVLVLENATTNPGGWYVSGIQEVLDCRVEDNNKEEYKKYLHTLGNLKVTHTTGDTSCEIVFPDGSVLKKSVDQLISSLEFAKGLLTRPMQFLRRRDELQKLLDVTVNKLLADDDFDQSEMHSLLNLIPLADARGFDCIRFEQAIFASVLRSMFDAAQVCVTAK